MRKFCALVLGLALCGCGDDSMQVGAGGSGGSGGAGGSAGSGGSGGMAGSGGSGGMAGTGGIGGTSGSGGATGDFISLGGGTLTESETHVAADANGNIVAAWIAIFADHTSSNGYTISHDNGVTWSALKRIDSPNTGAVASDPVLAADSAGHFYLTWVGFVRTQQNPQPTDMHVYVSKLGANDMFGMPVETSDGTTTVLLDKPWITVDAANNVLVTWLNFRQGIKFAKSTDGGATFTSTTLASGAQGNLTFPCVDPASSNTYYAVFSGGNSVELRKSTNGGMTWSMPSQTSPASDGTFQDPTCVVSGNDVWIAYPTATSGGGGGSTSTPPGGSVAVVHSTDGGVTFGNEVTVSNGGSGLVYLNPYLVRTPGGKLEVMYYQGSEGQPATLVHAESTDAGATWTRSDLAMTGTFTLNRRPGAWLGDYEGMYVNGGNVYTVFGDNSMSNTTHIRFKKFAAQ